MMQNKNKKYKDHHILKLNNFKVLDNGLGILMKKHILNKKLHIIHKLKIMDIHKKFNQIYIVGIKIINDFFIFL